ncbi:hypothetical protein M2418_005114 [Rhizobium sp. BIGb0125]|nr:hypothetical protein [Rhizobium sp. BIGb0125]
MVTGSNLSRRCLLAASAASTFAAIGLSSQTASATNTTPNTDAGRPWKTVGDVRSVGCHQRNSQTWKQSSIPCQQRP